MSGSVERATADIRFEIEQIDTLFEMYHDLFESVRSDNLSLVELTALASVLHSFYNGLENVFLSVAKKIDEQVPAGSQWHRDLLVQVSHPTSSRGAVISEQLATTLANYMVFRHFYRHSYSFILDWAELQELVRPLHRVWSETKSELCGFLSSGK